MAMMPTSGGMRIVPAAPPAAFKTYQIVTPLSSHFRPGTCEEADCPALANGWVSCIDETTELGQRQAHYIRRDSGRKFTEQREPSGLTAFTFEAGQKCFEQHKVRLERPEIFIARGGDWRGNPTGEVRRHVGPDDWVEDFAEHQDRIVTQIEAG